MPSKNADSENEDGDDDDNVGNGGDSPAAYQPDSVSGGEPKPSTLKITSKPPEKSPYTKIFNVFFIPSH
jgi:hypothetical protein